MVCFHGMRPFRKVERPPMGKLPRNSAFLKKLLKIMFDK